jgi:hypothetical protein
MLSKLKYVHVLFLGEQRELAAKIQKAQPAPKTQNEEEPRIAPRIQPRASVQKKPEPEVRTKPEVTVKPEVRTKPEATVKPETIKIVEPEMVEEEAEESLEESLSVDHNVQVLPENEIKQFENDEEEKSGKV